MKNTSYGQLLFSEIKPNQKSERYVTHISKLGLEQTNTLLITNKHVIYIKNKKSARKDWEILITNLKHIKEVGDSVYFYAESTTIHIIDNNSVFRLVSKDQTVTQQLVTTVNNLLLKSSPKAEKSSFFGRKSVS